MGGIDSLYEIGELLDMGMLGGERVPIFVGQEVLHPLKEGFHFGQWGFVGLLSGHWGLLQLYQLDLTSTVLRSCRSLLLTWLGKRAERLRDHYTRTLVISINYSKMGNGEGRKGS